MKKAGFNPRALFAASEPGAWYDPSDMSTMYQDAAGTTPVYMPGQGQVDPPVGLLLDKRLGLARGPELVSNGDFATDTWWSKDAGVAITGGACVFSAVTTSRGVYRSSLTQVGKCYVVTYTVVVNSGAIRPLIAGSFGVSRTTSGTYTEVLSGTSGALFGLFANPSFDGAVDNVSLREVLGNHAYQPTTTSRPTLSARYNQLTGTESLATQSVPVVATAYTLTTAGPGSVTLSGAASGTYMAGSRMVTCTAGALTLTVLGSVTQADLRPANDGVGLPPYQRVVDANTYDTVGFPLYLKFDGVDDWLQTVSIDFTTTDKVIAATALRKLSDAAVGVAFELSATAAGNNGAFLTAAPITASVANLYWQSNGTAASAATSPSAYPAPVSSILTGLGDISGDKAILRVNGSQVAQSGSDQGAGAYGNYPLYIGRRGGTSLSFNGRLYGLLIRGAATPDATITKVERYLNQKARIY